MSEVSIYAQRAILPAVFAVLAIAVYTDCRWRLIHNALTLPVMALGLLLHLAGRGWTGLAWGVLGLAIGFGLMMIPFAFGQMGGGDVKLMAALGSLLGAYAILHVFLYTTLAGGLLALGYAVCRREGVHTLRRAGQLATGLVRLRVNAHAESTTAQAITMPYGLAISAGTLLYLAFGKVV